MDIGVGVYDILNDNFNEKEFQPRSTEPVVRVMGMKKEDMPSEEGEGSQEERSDDSKLYYEFNSEEEISEGMSATTKSTFTGGQQEVKKPMIIDITPKEEVVQKEKGKNKRKKRLNRDR